jgi:hypothetical protein
VTTLLPITLLYAALLPLAVCLALDWRDRRRLELLADTDSGSA